MDNKVTFQEKRPFMKRHAPQKSSTKTSSVMAQFLINRGIVKKQSHASALLLLIALVAFSISAWLFFGNTTQHGGTIYREDIPEEILNQIPRDELKKIPSRN